MGDGASVTMQPFVGRGQNIFKIYFHRITIGSKQAKQSKTTQASGIIICFTPLPMIRSDGSGSGTRGLASPNPGFWLWLLPYSAPQLRQWDKNGPGLRRRNPNARPWCFVDQWARTARSWGTTAPRSTPSLALKSLWYILSTEDVRANFLSLFDGIGWLGYPLSWLKAPLGRFIDQRSLAPFSLVYKKWVAQGRAGHSTHIGRASHWTPLPLAVMVLTKAGRHTTIECV